ATIPSSSHNKLRQLFSLRLAPHLVLENHHPSTLKHQIHTVLYHQDTPTLSPPATTRPLRTLSTTLQPTTSLLLSILRSEAWIHPYIWPNPFLNLHCNHSVEVSSIFLPVIQARCKKLLQSKRD
ncbi:hypothetical protein LTR28_002266, partial [Elasticomyces elasticus]